MEISSKKHEELASKIGKVADYLILLGKDWTVIPLENIIAELQRVDVKIIAAVKDFDEAKLALETLEYGTDGVLLLPEDISQIKKVAEFIEKIDSESYSTCTCNYNTCRTSWFRRQGMCGYLFHDECWGGNANRILLQGTFPGSQ